MSIRSNDQIVKYLRVLDRSSEKWKKSITYFEDHFRRTDKKTGNRCFKPGYFDELKNLMEEFFIPYNDFTNEVMHMYVIKGDLSLFSKVHVNYLSDSDVIYNYEYTAPSIIFEICSYPSLAKWIQLYKDHRERLEKLEEAQGHIKRKHPKIDLYLELYKRKLNGDSVQRIFSNMPEINKELDNTTAYTLKEVKKLIEVAESLIGGI